MESPLKSKAPERIWVYVSGPTHCRECLRGTEILRGKHFVTLCKIIGCTTEAFQMFEVFQVFTAASGQFGNQMG